MSFAETERTIECDECGTVDEISSEYSEQAAEEDGWYLSENRNLCPDCNDICFDL